MSITEEYFIGMDVLELEKDYWNSEKDKEKKLPATTPTTPTTTFILSANTTPTPPTPTKTPITNSTTSPPSTSTSSIPETI